MAPKRSRCPESLNEEEMAMCTQQLELLASFRDKKQRRIVASENGNPSQNPSKRLTVTGQELGQPEKQTGKSILEWGLPTLNPLEIRLQNGVGDFLEACSLCKKKLHGNDVFMYGNFGAFCSIQCRNHQIISDGYHVEYFCQSEDFLTPIMK